MYETTTLNIDGCIIKDVEEYALKDNIKYIIGIYDSRYDFYWFWGAFSAGREDAADETVRVCSSRRKKFVINK